MLKIVLFSDKYAIENSYTRKIYHITHCSTDIGDTIEDVENAVEDVENAVEEVQEGGGVVYANNAARRRINRGIFIIFYQFDMYFNFFVIYVSDDRVRVYSRFSAK